MQKYRKIRETQNKQVMKIRFCDFYCPGAKTAGRRGRHRQTGRPCSVFTIQEYAGRAWHYSRKTFSCREYPAENVKKAERGLESEQKKMSGSKNLPANRGRQQLSLFAGSFVVDTSTGEMQEDGLSLLNILNDWFSLQ